uniref:Uncharacterized protein n=1 Tax=Cryptomonas curvata TaxID=233186 RepID=A0A7S0MFA1_9CRYP|mmetsp:Transcript_38426/g.80572  ORF Transcript_38426/g.80572 Transcript_38426/m.80572 type:complete len:209 (+) Transcript_38426:117-743(+)|eukprot:CAMPEP_0172179926 /NCGR_PEP_ID=MMETSP1050-20130122/16905_1 /TAXON_ID=233186 /ORGANISM="Cryptomonas curvata, Strain CCAP979/52" /LENGTH=208 /DNA_ID=CAMNT_0012852895 /DNA_START=50 /DNA_END=676 /DNA_ORIENTATION=-
MRFFTSIGKAKTADVEKTCSKSEGQKKKRWALFRLFRAKKAVKNAVDEKQAEMTEKFELENRIMKWLSESSREDISNHLDLIKSSRQIDAESAPEDAEANLCQPLRQDDVKGEAFSAKKRIEDRDDNMPSTAEVAQSTPSLAFRSDRPTCMVTPRRDVLRPCNFQQGLIRLGGLEGILDLPSGLRTNYGLTVADSFRSLAAPLCGGAR